MPGGGSISAQPHPALGPFKELERRWARLCCRLAPSGGDEGRVNRQASTARGSNRAEVSLLVTAFGSAVMS